MLNKKWCYCQKKTGSINKKVKPEKLKNSETAPKNQKKLKKNEIKVIKNGYSNNSAFLQLMVSNNKIHLHQNYGTKKYMQPMRIEIYIYHHRD